MNDNTPDFKPFEVGRERLCGDNEGAWLRVSIFDKSASGKDDFLSRGYFNLYGLLGGETKVKTFTASGEKSAKLIFEQFEKVEGIDLVDVIS